MTAERLAELAWSAANTKRLRAAGAVEVGAGHYPMLVGLHAVWLGGLWILAWDRPVSLFFVALFILLQFGRAWVLVALGRRWTTRILFMPGERLVASGPYRLVRHPNYVIVALEIAVLPLAFGLVWFAVAFSAANAVALIVRIEAEDAALASARGPSARG